jgi:hypothetical protein
LVTQPYTTVEQLHWQVRVELGGGVYRGVQPGVPERGLEPLVLFDDAAALPGERSTMCIAPANLTAANVRKAIHAKREEYARFEEFAAKATARVFGQFAPKEAA